MIQYKHCKNAGKLTKKQKVSPGRAVQTFSLKQMKDIGLLRNSASSSAVCPPVMTSCRCRLCRVLHNGGDSPKSMNILSIDSLLYDHGYCSKPFFHCMHHFHWGYCGQCTINPDFLV